MTAETNDLIPAAETRLRTALAAAASTDPVPDAWATIRSRLEDDDVIALRAPRCRWPMLVAAAVLVLVALAIVAAATRGTGDEVRANGAESYCTVLARPARSGVTVTVSLQPDATEADVAAVRAFLEGTSGTTELAYTTRAEAFAHARELFADDPTTRDLLREEDVPSSFSLVAVDLAAADAVIAAAEDRTDVLTADVDREDPIPDLFTVLVAIGRGQTEIPLEAGFRPVDPEVVAAFRAAAPAELGDEVALVAGALAHPSEATPQVHTVASRLASDAADRCGRAMPSSPESESPATTDPAASTTTEPG